MLLDQLKEITGIQDSSFLHAALKVGACCHCSVGRRPESQASSKHSAWVGWAAVTAIWCMLCGAVCIL